MQAKGTGWILFSWVVLMTSGVMAVINGIIALGNSASVDELDGNDLPCGLQ